MRKANLCQQVIPPGHLVCDTLCHRVRAGEDSRLKRLRIEAAVNLNESKLGTLRTMEELVND